MTSIVDLAFAVQAVEPLSADHGYYLYSALSRVLPILHSGNGVAVHPLRGILTGARQLTLQGWSRLMLRTDVSRIPEIVPLAGKTLRVGPALLRVGVPEIRALAGGPTVRSRLVTIRNGTEPERFIQEVRRKLDALDISPDAQILLPPRDGRPIRRTLRIKDKEIVGYEVVVERLTPAESLALQANHFPEPALRFARSHMGCGVFVPVEKIESSDDA